MIHSTPFYDHKFFTAICGDVVAMPGLSVVLQVYFLKVEEEDEEKEDLKHAMLKRLAALRRKENLL